MNKHWCRQMTAVMVAGLLPLAAWGQAFPAKPLRLVVPFPPGAGVDVFTRIVAPPFGERLGQQVVVENRGGASGVIAATQIMKAAPDGYTTMMATASMLTVSPAMKKLPYNVDQDFTYITQTGATNMILVVRPELQVQNLREFIDLVKSRPGKVTYASTGTATPPHMAAELLKLRAGINLVHVPYKGSGPAMSDLIGGHVDAFFVNMESSLPLIRSGKLRPLAVTSYRRNEQTPEVPTMAEAGFSDFVAGNTWYGLVGPARIPGEVVERLYPELVKVLRAPDMQEKLKTAGAVVVASTPKEFADSVREELRIWTGFIKQTGISAD